MSYISLALDNKVAPLPNKPTPPVAKPNATVSASNIPATIEEGIDKAKGISLATMFKSFK